jgi:spore germination protein GerM
VRRRSASAKVIAHPNPEEHPMSRTASVRRAQVILVAIAVALAAFAFVVIREQPADDDGAGVADEPSTPSTTSTVPATSTTPAPTTTAPSGAPVAVRTYFVRNELVATVGRTAEAPAVARGAVEALLTGPDEREAQLGMSTAVPTGTELRSIDIEGGEASVDLTGTFAAGGGSLSMQLRVAQVVFTLTQFETVERVTILLDGQAVDAIGGEGIDATDLTRADVTSVTPAILVESPVPFQAVEADLQVTGASNTFEATLLYELRDSVGEIVDQGFATATAGSGTWGTFAFALDTRTAAVGPALLTLWQEDADSGDRVDVYEVPLEV